MGKLVKLLETDDNQSYRKSILYYIPDRLGRNYYNRYPDYTNIWPTVCGDCKSLMGDFYIHGQEFWGNPNGISGYAPPGISGVNIRSIGASGEEVVVGTRWYVADNKYIRLSSITNPYSHLPKYFRLTYNFYANNAVVLTLYQDLAGYEFVPLFPFITEEWDVGSDGTVTHQSGYKILHEAKLNYFSSGYIFSYGTSTGASDSQKAAWDAFWGDVPVIDPDNPYAIGGTSEPGGGGGNFSEDSDDVETDDMPSESTASAVGSGFSTIFLPTKSQLRRLSETFWGSTVVGFFQNMVENISDMFVSLGVLPFTLTHGSTVSVQWLGLIDTAISLDLAPRQYYEFDMGSINLASDSRIFTSGSVLDYSPYSRLGIYLPFIGYQELDIDECRDAVVGLKYRIDIMSGCCVAIISIAGKEIYQFSGNCLSQIPLTSQDMSGILTGAVQVATAGVGLGVNGAVASAGGEVSAELAAQGKMSEAAVNLDKTQRVGRVANSAGQLVSATANAAMGIKPTYNKTGSVSAANALLAVKQPYLFLITPRQSMPDHYQKYCGFPSNITGKLNEFSGFTVVEDIRLNGLVATNTEVEEIYDLLKSGVIV